MLSGVSLGSLIMIAFVGLLVFGPSRLKTISREMGEAISEFRLGLDKGSQKNDRD